MTLVLSENFPPKVGGSGRWLWEIYRRLPREDYVIAAGEDIHQQEFDDSHDLRLHRMPLSFPTRLLRPRSAPYYWSSVRRLLALARREETEILHCGRCLCEGFLGLLVKLRTGIPFACFTHGEEINISNAQQVPPWHTRRVYGSREVATMVGLVLRNARFLVANSRNTRSILVDRWGLESERVFLLHPGVDTERFRPGPPDPQVRAQLGWNDRRVVVTVGRLQKRKGHDLLIRAIPRIRDSVSDLLYAIVGDGEELESLKNLVESTSLENHVQFLHGLSDDELVHCYQQCDLFVLPNRQIGGDIEGFGMVLLEAQACGKSVIAGASGGTSETMKVEQTGLTVACEDPEHLARAIEELLGNRSRLESMGRAGRGWVVENFDWEPLTREAQRIFSQGLRLA